MIRTICFLVAPLEKIRLHFTEKKTRIQYSMRQRTADGYTKKSFTESSRRSMSKLIKFQEKGKNTNEGGGIERASKRMNGKPCFCFEYKLLQPQIRKLPKERFYLQSLRFQLSWTLLCQGLIATTRKCKWRSQH